ncbi:ankyrin repeat domain-containing protein [Candidatus Dependentiae bacterium]|nr:ankyrin repeat domain-containing protein [Candidatus Dependentiae bacterium]MBU4386984.1 ankyrin repeat domain-containing protein [Candidatus Dependentiae bacterium]MCG2756120.1 ankyrin repeat domain-containing protein [Candidatus Dependentiae bacterium]
MNSIKKIIIVTATTANFVFSCFAGEIEQKLMTAIIEKDSKTVKSLIDENDLDLNKKYKFDNEPDYEQTILIAAVWRNGKKIVELLINKAIQINEQNPGFLETFLNTKDKNGNTVLYITAKKFGNYGDIAKLLIDTAIQINEQNPDFLETFLNAKNNVNGWTALHCAAFGGSIEVTELLIDTAIQINEQNPKFLEFFLNAKDNGGKTALNLATSQAINGKSGYYYQVVELLKEANKYLEEQANSTKEDGWNEEYVNELFLNDGFGFDGELEQKLMNAIIEKDSKTVKSLIDKNNLDLNKKYKFDNKQDYEQTILMAAVCGNDIKIVELLINKAIQINKENSGFLETFLNAEDNYGWTVLNYAAFDGNIEITELLIATAKQINEQNPKFLETFLNGKDNGGWTVFDMALKQAINGEDSCKFFKLLEQVNFRFEDDFDGFDRGDCDCCDYGD